MWDNIYQPYQTGSEGGLIIADEEYRDSCRITLEKCERYYAITCRSEDTRLNSSHAR